MKRSREVGILMEVFTEKNLIANEEETKEAIQEGLKRIRQEKFAARRLCRRGGAIHAKE